MNLEGVEMSEETGRTYYDGVLDTVLFLMEELASERSNKQLLAELVEIQRTVIDERTADFRAKFKTDQWVFESSN